MEYDRKIAYDLLCLIDQNFMRKSGGAAMIEKTLEVIEWEYRWMKRFGRMVVFAIMLFPLLQFGPLLWKDGSYSGRWNFAANMEPQPIDCKGVAYILQTCELKFSEKNDGRTMVIEYLLFGTDWSGVVPDIIRASNGTYSSSVAVSGPGLLARAGAILALFIMLLLIEKIGLLMIWRAMVDQLPTPPPPVVRSTETVSLSRDRRDHM